MNIDLELAIQHLKMIAHHWGKRKNEPLNKKECEILLKFLESDL